MKRAVQLLIVNPLAAYCCAIHPANAQVGPPGSLPSDSTRDSERSRHEASRLEDRLTRILVDDGYANVAAVAEHGRVSVVYENARYRDPRRGLRHAAELLQPEIAPGQELILVPTVGAVPIISSRYSTSAQPADGSLPRPGGVSLDVSDLPPGLLKRSRASSSFGRVDVVVHPWFEARFGNYDNPVASRTGIAPEVRVAIRRGLVVSGQALFTIQDDLPTGESRVRPGVVTVSQTERLPRNIFVSATAGTFADDRYGVGLETDAYSANGRWSVGAELGLTGESSYASRRWGFSRMSEPTALLIATARVPRYAVTVRTTAGVFLADQRGVRVRRSPPLRRVQAGVVRRRNRRWCERRCDAANPASAATIRQARASAAAGRGVVPVGLPLSRRSSEWRSIYTRPGAQRIRRCPL